MCLEGVDQKDGHQPEQLDGVQLDSFISKLKYCLQIHIRRVSEEEFSGQPSTMSKAAERPTIIVVTISSYATLPVSSHTSLEVASTVGWVKNRVIF